MPKLLIAVLILVGLGVHAVSFAEMGDVTIAGEPKPWHPVTLTMEGRETSENAEGLNPFLDYRMTVLFRHESGTPAYTVAGYYAADGNGAETSAAAGNIWRAHLMPDTPGTWTYRAVLASGPGAALDADQGKTVPGCEREGSFVVGAADAAAPGFHGKGRLEYVGGHYLRFAGTGEYYLKGGADSPENFLAYGDFDGTFDADAASASYNHIGGFLHAYAPHVRDWREGDPSWQDGKGKGMIGALNYLAGKGMNSVYFLTYNIDRGDGRDTWMWTTPEERERFDCSKLDQWELVFSHMDRLGLMLHVVTQETENDRRLGGSAGLNEIRKLYYRELVARYAHHLAVIWNLGEENNTPDADRKAIAAYIRELDPYNHPITVHTHNNKAMTFYDGILGDPNFEATSIQGDMANYNRDALVLRERSAEAGRKWAIFGDEQPPASHGVLPDADDPSHDLPRTQALWGNLMGGGSGVEWYFGHQYPNMDINCEDWRSRDAIWDQTRHALEFFQQHLPFQAMTPDNALAFGARAYVLAQPGEVYCVYLPEGGGPELNVAGPGAYTVRWYDPRHGGALQTGSVSAVTGPGMVFLGTPPSESGKDWAVLVKRQ